MDGIRTIPVLTQLSTGGLLAREFATLVVPQHQTKVHTAMQQGEAYAPFSFNEREDTLVILDARGIERLDRIAVGFGRLAIPRHPAKGLLGQIRGEPKPSAHVIVQHGLHTHDIDNALRNRGMDVRTSVGKGLQRGINMRRLIVRRLNFANQRQCLFYANNYISMLTSMLWGESCWPFRPTNVSSPWLK